MVRYAKNCQLPCNPTPQENLKYQRQYKMAQFFTISEDSLKNRMKSFFNNHLSQLVQTYSLVEKGLSSKIYQLQNKRQGAILSQKKNGLQKLSFYFEENDIMLKTVENQMRKNFIKEIESIQKKIKQSLDQTIKMYDVIIKKQIQYVRLNIQKNVSKVQREIKKLQRETENLQRTQGKLSESEISAFLNISLDDIKGYTTILKIISKPSPLMRKIRILQENFSKGDHQASQKEIQSLNISCESINCGQIWNVIQLMKRKRDFQTSFSFSQSQISVQNSFRSFQEGIHDSSNKGSFITFNSNQLNPEVELDHDNLIENYKILLTSIEAKIISRLYDILHFQMKKELTDGTNQQKQKQPLSFYLRDIEVYSIFCRSKESIQGQFVKLDEKNQRSKYLFKQTSKLAYYEPLNSSSEKDDSDYEQQDNQRIREIKTNLKKEQILRQRSVERQPGTIRKSTQNLSQKKENLSLSYDNRNRESSFFSMNSQRKPQNKSYEIKNQQFFKSQVKAKKESVQIQQKQKQKQKDNNQYNLQKPKNIYLNEQVPKFSSTLTFSPFKYLQNQQKQDNIKKQLSVVNDQPSYKTQYQEYNEDLSRIYYATDSDQEQKPQKQKSVKIKQEINKQQQNKQNSQIIQQKNSENDQSSQSQMEKYRQKMRKKAEQSQQKQKDEKVQQKVQTKIINGQIQQEERKMFEYSKKLDKQENEKDAKSNSSKSKSQQPSQMNTNRFKQYFQEDQNQYGKLRNQYKQFNPLNQSQHQKSMALSESEIQKNPQLKKMAEQWKKQRSNSVHSQSALRNQTGSRERLIINSTQQIQNWLPEQISKYVDIQEQRRIEESIIRKRTIRNESKQESMFLKKQNKSNETQLVPHEQESQSERQLRKRKQLEASENLILQIALEDSLQFKALNQNQPLRIRENERASQIMQEKLKMQQKVLKMKTQTEKQQYQENQEDLQEDFTRFQEFFKGMSKIKLAFSMDQKSGLSFLDDLEEPVQPNTRRRLNQEIRIKELKQRQEELAISSQQFSIVLRILKPILITFRSLDNRKNSPMVKYFVGDETGVAVLYMRYHCDVKPGVCLKLNRCRICNYKGSFEITNYSQITRANVLPEKFMSQIKFSNQLSSLRGDSIAQLSYGVKPHFNDVLRDCVRDLLKSGQRQKLLLKPLILTVCDGSLTSKRYILGDYTGRIQADFNNCSKFLSKHQTVVLRKIRICIRGDQIILVAERNTALLKAEQLWQFKHDLKYIPSEQFRPR